MVVANASCSWVFLVDTVDSKKNGLVGGTAALIFLITSEICLFISCF